MRQIIDAAEIDAISRNKAFCFQVIVEEKTYRLCAADEEDLAKWLGALKSVLARRREGERERREASNAGGAAGVAKGKEKGIGSGQGQGQGIVEKTEGLSLR